MCFLGCGVEGWGGGGGVRRGGWGRGVAAARKTERQGRHQCCVSASRGGSSCQAMHIINASSTHTPESPTPHLDKHDSAASSPWLGGRGELVDGCHKLVLRLKGNRGDTRATVLNRRWVEACLDGGCDQGHLCWRAHRGVHCRAGRAGRVHGSNNIQQHSKGCCDIFASSAQERTGEQTTEWREGESVESDRWKITPQ